jgi:hypothetical protein
VASLFFEGLHVLGAFFADIEDWSEATPLASAGKLCRRRATLTVTTMGRCSRQPEGSSAMEAVLAGDVKGSRCEGEFVVVSPGRSSLSAKPTHRVTSALSGRGLSLRTVQSCVSEAHNALATYGASESRLLRHARPSCLVAEAV